MNNNNLNIFLNNKYGVIGRSVSTKMEPNTSSEFQFWLSDRSNKHPKLLEQGPEQNSEAEKIATVEIGNIVAAYTDSNDDITFGLVVEMRSYSDIDSFIADYLSHNFGDAEIEVPTDISEVIVVTCSVMRNVSLLTKPIGRSRVFFPSEMGIKFAYGIVDEKGDSTYSGASIPFGIFENGDGTKTPISVDEEFLLGPEAAHLNVSGISGLATKTSSVEFAIKSLLEKTDKKVAVVMLNVKSKDLLYIDQPNPKASEDKWSKDAYEVLGIPNTPFAEARFFAPADPENNPNGTKSLRKLKTERFQWDLSLMYHDIPSLFNPLDWDDKMEGVWFVIRDRIEQGEFNTYGQMMTWISKEIKNNGAEKQWLLGSHIATWNKMRSHLQRFPSTFAGLITGAGKGADIPWDQLKSKSIFVIDIQMLNDRGQRLVFGRSVRALSEMLENDITDLDAIVVFVDELNKFAPSGNVRSPLKENLINITARGRSLGLVLFGAEQFASSVDKEIVENSSTYLFGRTETNELRTSIFSAFTDEVKTKLTMLPQGNLLIKFSKFPQPIFLRFPFPPCLPGDKFITPQDKSEGDH